MAKADKDEELFINSLEGKRLVRLEVSSPGQYEPIVHAGEGRLTVSKSKLVIFFNGKMFFETKRKNLFCGALLSGNGVRIQGYDLICKEDLGITAYFSYITEK